MQQNVYAKCKTIYINMILCRNESLNSDGHQFHQHQQNQQPPVTSNDLTQKITTTQGFGNPYAGL